MEHISYGSEHPYEDGKLYFQVLESKVLQKDLDISDMDSRDILFLFGARNNAIFVLNDKRHPLYEGSFLSICGPQNVRISNVCGAVFIMLLRRCEPFESDFQLEDLLETQHGVQNIFSRKNVFYSVSNAYSIYSLFLEVMFEGSHMTLESKAILQSLMAAMIIRIVCSENDRHVEKPDYVQNAKRYIQEHYSEELDAELLAGKQWISKAYLQSIFRKQSGHSINEYITHIRVDRAAELLRRENVSVTDIAFRCGFNNRQWFSKVFERQIGVSPAEYKRKLNTERGSKK